MLKGNGLMPETKALVVYEAVKEAKQTAIDFDEAVKEAKQLLAAADKDQWRLAELAHLVDTKYGEKKLEAFAEAIGVAACTLERKRSVYRAWHNDQIPGPAPESFEVATALQTHPDRARIVRDFPDLTRSKARALMSAYDDTPPSDQPNSPPERGTAAYWQGQFIVEATKMTGRARDARDYAQMLWNKWLSNSRNDVTDLMEINFREVAAMFLEAAAEWTKAADRCAELLKLQDTPFDSCDAPALADELTESVDG